jgi:hypothetical protein
MKELDPHIPETNKEKTEIHAVVPAKAEKVYKASLFLHKGQKAWECNLITKEIVEAQYNSMAAFTKDGTPYTKNELVMKENHVYFTAINQKNAKVKLDKYLKNLKIAMIQQAFNNQQQ